MLQHPRLSGFPSRDPRHIMGQKHPGAGRYTEQLPLEGDPAAWVTQKVLRTKRGQKAEKAKVGGAPDKESNAVGGGAGEKEPL